MEEQFYLVWPLVMAGLLGLGRRRLPEISRWLLLTALVVAVAVALLYYPGHDLTAPSASWMIGGHPFAKIDTLYLSTITRGGGLLIGAAFAMLWRPSAVMRGPLRTKGRLLDVVGTVGLVALVFMALVVAPRDARRRRSLAVPRRVHRRRPRHHHGDRGGHASRVARRAPPRHPDARLRRHPLLRPVPVPLADLRDHPRRRRQPHVGHRVRHRDGAHRDHHRGVVPFRRDPDPPSTGRRHPRSAARRHEPRHPPPGGRRRRRRRGARRVRRREPGDRPAAPERLRRVAGRRRTGGHRHRRSPPPRWRRSPRRRRRRASPRPPRSPGPSPRPPRRPPP